MGTIKAGDIGRLSTTTTTDSTDLLMVYRDGVLQTATIADATIGVGLETEAVVVTNASGEFISDKANLAFDGGKLRIDQLIPLNTGSMTGLGKSTDNAQISAAATEVITIGSNAQLQFYDFAAGGGTYTYNIDLADSGSQGSVFEINVIKAASANPTIVFRNGSAGATLLSINNANAEVWNLRFYRKSSDWVLLASNIND